MPHRVYFICIVMSVACQLMLAGCESRGESKEEACYRATRAMAEVWEHMHTDAAQGNQAGWLEAFHAAAAWQRKVCPAPEAPPVKLEEPKNAPKE